MNVSDHDAILGNLINQGPVSHLKNIKFRDHTNQSVSSFKLHLSDSLESFNKFNNFSIDNKFKMLIKIIETTYNMHCKIKSKDVSTKKLTSAWMTDCIKSLIREKHRLHRPSVSMPQYDKLYTNQAKLLKKPCSLQCLITIQIN